jgi:hypothetical protein
MKNNSEQRKNERRLKALQRLEDNFNKSVKLLPDWQVNHIANAISVLENKLKIK